jgi:hypothetical protein
MYAEISLRTSIPYFNPNANQQAAYDKKGPVSLSEQCWRVILHRCIPISKERVAVLPDWLLAEIVNRLLNTGKLSRAILEPFQATNKMGVITRLDLRGYPAQTPHTNTRTNTKQTTHQISHSQPSLKHTTSEGEHFAHRSNSLDLGDRTEETRVTTAPGQAPRSLRHSLSQSGGGHVVGTANTNMIDLLWLLVNAPNLVYFSLRSHKSFRINDADLVQIAQSVTPSLMSMDIRYCTSDHRVTLKGMSAAIGHFNMSQLTFLDVSWTSVDDETLQSMVTGCKWLRHLYIEHCNRLTLRFDENGTGILDLAPNLLTLHAKGCEQLGKRHPVKLASDTLTHLNLANCPNIGDDSLELFNCPRLMSLNLQHCIRITDHSVSEVLHVCRHLQLLDLQFTNLESPEFNEKSASIKELHLCDSVNISLTALQWIAYYCTGLSELHVRGVKAINDVSLEQLFVEPHEFAAISYQLNSSAEIPPLANPLRASSHHFKEESAKKKSSSVSRYFAGLKKLNASRCASLSTKGVTHIAKHVTGLDWLDLSWTGVDDNVFDVLVQHCTHLRSIKLFGCNAITHEAINRTKSERTTLDIFSVSQPLDWCLYGEIS